MLLSVALHAAPAIGLPWVAHSCGEQDPPPPASEMPFGVSLVYVEDTAAKAGESVLRDDAETGRDHSAAETDTRRGLEPAQRWNEASRRAAEIGVPAEARPAVGDNAPVQVHTATVGTVAISRPQPAPVEAPRQQIAAIASLRWSSEKPAAKRGGVTAASGQPGSSRAQQDRECAIQKIKRRIEKVMPFVYWSSRLRDQVAGSAHVRFRLSRRGYVHEIQVIDVTGELELREATRAALHLAEPYVFVSGWIELRLVFRG
jgi:outer membrane biosynthesis protein TonB